MADIRELSPAGRRLEARAVLLNTWPRLVKVHDALDLPEGRAGLTRRRERSIAFRDCLPADVGFEMATADGLGAGPETPTRRWALVVVVEADDADAAYTRLDDLTLDAGCRDVVYLGDACPMIPATEYKTEQIRLLADGEIAYTAP